MSYYSEKEAIFSAFYALVDDVAIENLRGIEVKCYKITLPRQIAKEDCPLFSIVYTDISGGGIETDQADVELPNIIRVTFGILDYSEVNAEDASRYTTDLIDKVIIRLKTNPSLDSKLKGMLVANISPGFTEEKAVFFSMPSLTVLLDSKK